MEDGLLQEEVAMARLDPPNDEVLEEFLNRSLDVRYISGQTPQVFMA